MCTQLEQSLIDQLKVHAFHTKPDSSELFNHPSEAVLHPLLKSLKIDSYIFVPLKTKNAVIGNIAFLRTASHPQGAFNELDHQMACEIGARSALGIENARLFLEAREAIQAREHMMATVSHDLQNPLAATSVGIELLGRLTSSSDLGPQVAAITSKIDVSIARMNTMIKQLLDFEKMRSGTFLLEKSSTPVHSLITGATSESEPLCKKKGIRFTTAVESSLINTQLLCDSDKILRVLSNLIGNSVKFTPQDGKIDLTVSQDPSNLIFKVSDTGIGIPKEEFANVFKIYWQAKGTCSQGNGLGLAIARGIVEAHNGKIWIEPPSGAGSVFGFSIPK
jgi:signal transduction histidine kinase